MTSSILDLGPLGTCSFEHGFLVGTVNHAHRKMTKCVDFKPLVLRKPVPDEK